MRLFLLIQNIFRPTAPVIHSFPAAELRFAHCIYLAMGPFQLWVAFTSQGDQGGRSPTTSDANSASTKSEGTLQIGPTARGGGCP